MAWEKVSNQKASYFLHDKVLEFVNWKIKKKLRNELGGEVEKCIKHRSRNDKKATEILYNSFYFLDAQVVGQGGSDFLELWA